MNKSQTIPVSTENDVIFARMQTRQLARALGLPIADQARISLAASSLAHTIKLGETCKGYIIISGIQEGKRHGLQIVCRASCTSNESDDLRRALEDARWMLMVDELDVRTSVDSQTEANNIEITAIKWTK
jgi:hypothetical protein